MVQESENTSIQAPDHPKPAEVFPWQEAILWMLLLGLLFLVGYSTTNRWAADQLATLSLHSAWDAHIPFLAWTIVPYLSLNLMFPCTFFAFHETRALRRHAARIAVAQMTCFIIFALLPSHNVRIAPETDGVMGLLFAQLRAFEQPYNMFPSLHAAVLLLVWSAVLPLLAPRSLTRSIWHGWC